MAATTASSTASGPAGVLCLTRPSARPVAGSTSGRGSWCRRGRPRSRRRRTTSGRHQASAGPRSRRQNVLVGLGGLDRRRWRVLTSAISGGAVSSSPSAASAARPRLHLAGLDRRRPDRPRRPEPRPAPRHLQRRSAPGGGADGGDGALGVVLAEVPVADDPLPLGVAVDPLTVATELGIVLRQAGAGGRSPDSRSRRASSGRRSAPASPSGERPARCRPARRGPPVGGLLRARNQSWPTILLPPEGVFGGARAHGRTGLGKISGPFGPRMGTKWAAGTS